LRRSDMFLLLYFSRHCDERSDEAIQTCFRGGISGLLRCARNDGGD
jgi:hypothetical protein